MNTFFRKRWFTRYSRPFPESEGALPRIDFLLSLLEEEQAETFSNSRGRFQAGFFYAERYHARLPYLRPDNNIFCQALIAYNLQRAARTLQVINQPERATRCLAIADKITSHYSAFKNYHHRNTYGFWQLHPRWYWPFGYFFHRNEFFRPPDDADDTALVYLTQPQPPPVQNWLHTVQLKAYANQPTTERRVKNTFPNWEDKNAYTTFFAEKMPAGLDVSVMVNVLAWVCLQINKPESGLQSFTQADRDTLRCVSICVESKFWLNPHKASPYYPFPAVIYFNLCRFAEIASRNKAEVGRPFNEFAQMAIPVLKEHFDNAQKLAASPMERILVGHGGLLLGLPTPTPGAKDLSQALADKGFSYFAFPVVQEYGGAIPRYLSDLKILQIRFRCLALNASFLTEMLAFSLQSE